MDAYPESMKRDLHAIRAVRNKFAHPSMGVHFDDADVAACFLKFADSVPRLTSPSIFPEEIERMHGGVKPPTQLSANDRLFARWSTSFIATSSSTPVSGCNLYK
jgi:hypothetical protein